MSFASDVGVAFFVPGVTSPVEDTVAGVEAAIDLSLEGFAGVLFTAGATWVLSDDGSSADTLTSTDGVLASLVAAVVAAVVSAELLVFGTIGGFAADGFGVEVVFE
jgi:hypothetical protein